jgi:siroheme synthase (precorrin-2 oxidase/ferrochelatase)
MRVKLEDILKPGAELIVKKIDFNDPEIKRLFEETKKRQIQLKKLRGWRYEGWWRKL